MLQCEGDDSGKYAETESEREREATHALAALQVAARWKRHMFICDNMFVADTKQWDWMDRFLSSSCRRISLWIWILYICIKTKIWVLTTFLYDHSIIFNRSGCIYITDPSNSILQLFSKLSRWLFAENSDAVNALNSLPLHFCEAASYYWLKPYTAKTPSSLCLSN